jgi:hypothetical protein
MSELTVPVQLTEREMRAIAGYFGHHQVGFTNLVAKIAAARPAMQQAKREKNRAAKLAREARKVAEA